MEYFDVVDQEGNPTGLTVSREEAHAEGIRHRTAHIWIVRKEGRRVQVLLQKRSQNKDSFPGQYDTSSAGHIQAGDQPLESAIRELGEELGIHAGPDDLAFIGNFDIVYSKEFHGKMFRDNEITFVYLYKLPVEIDKLTLQKEEVESVAWFDLEQTYQDCMNHDPRFCVPIEGLGILREAVGE
ncbi:MAG: NUDIX domain-containing protein [Eubacterium sp.]|nr:NUDIX domain-containing protein [Eubacterium sp.]